MCQDREMMKDVFVQGSAEQHLLKMNVRLKTESPPRAGRVWGMREGSRWCRAAAGAAGWAGGEQCSPAQSCAKVAGGELIRQRLKRCEGSWCCVSQEQHRSSILGPEHRRGNGRVWEMLHLCIPWRPGLSTGCRGEAGGGMKLCVQTACGDLSSLHSSRCFMNLLMMLLAHVLYHGNEP